MRYLALVLFICLASTLSAQNYKSRIHYRVNIGDTSQIHQLILLDYSKLLGTAEEINNDTIYFKVRAAVETSAIPVKQMRYLGEYLPKVKGRRTFNSVSVIPAFSDMTYERTALPFTSKGQLRIVQLLYIVSEFNLNDHVQIGVGLAGPLGILTTQKLRTSITPKVHLALSNQLLYLPVLSGFENTTVIIGDVSAIATLGDENAFLNIGYGRFYNTDTNGDSAWLPRAGGGGRISPKWHLYGEAIISLNRESSLLELYPSVNASYGSRRHRFQFGFATIFRDQDNFFPPPIPYVGYVRYY